MTSLAAPAPLAAAKPTAIAPPVFGPRIIIGLVGVLLAVLVSGLNEMVTKVALADIRGAMYIGFDEGTWLVAAYTATSVSAMAFAPWCSVTFSLRRFTLCAIGLFTVLGVLCPFAPNYESLLILRTVQGLAGGALPPMLMTVALRFLPANVKLYGLAGYALTATFGPSLGTPLAAFWTEYVGWQWAFWQIVGPCLLAMAAVAYGLPQDPLRLQRFKQFNWRGLLLGFPAICMLVIGLLQGNRLDWFESPLIATLLIGGLVLLVLFMINEWSHPMPFFKLQMLGIRNLSFALIVLAGVLIVLLAVTIIPSSYLAQVQGYRPLQTARVSGSGTDEYDGHQAINVPKLRASLHGDYSIPGIKGLALLGGVQYSGSKYANREASVKVDDYAVFDVGGRYSTKVGDYDTVLRLTVDNLFDKRYWRDVGESAGDGYLFLGAPRTARLSATVNF